jgi:hypothetical protein
VNCRCTSPHHSSNRITLGAVARFLLALGLIVAAVLAARAEPPTDAEIAKFIRCGNERVEE